MMNILGEKQVCKVCNQEMIPNVGMEKSSVIIIGDFSEHESILMDRQFEVLQQELIKNGIDWKQIRTVSLWRHKPFKSPSRKKEDLKMTETRNNACMKHFNDLLWDEVIGKRAMLVVGTSTVNELFGISAKMYCGVPLYHLENPFPCDLVTVTTKPTEVFHNPPGEIKLAIYKFANEILKRKFYG